MNRLNELTEALPVEPRERVRKLRTDMGLTQEDLAKKLGITRTAISDIERVNSERTLGVKMAKTLAAVFGIDFRELL